MDVPACLRYEAGSEPAYAYIPFVRRGEDEEPNYTLEEEERVMMKQVKETQGFDMNFKQFRCIFNYQPLDLDDNEFAINEPETTRELMDRLSWGSLEGYNVYKDPKYEFVKVIKANYHMNATAAIMCFITFQGKDLSNDQPKHFHAKVCNFYYKPHKYISCHLKPEKKVHSIETGEKEDVKKPRLTDELSNV